MNNVVASVVGVAGCFVPILAEVDASSLEGLIQNGAYGAGAGILLWQLIKSYNRIDKLQQKIMELEERMLHMCSGCEHVRYANEIAKRLHHETMEHITGEHEPQKGRLQ